MINNPKLIEKIKQQLRNTTREQLEKAIKLVDEEYNTKIKLSEVEYKNIYSTNNEYSTFSVHKNRTNSLFNVFLKNKYKEEKNEWRAA